MRAFRPSQFAPLEEGPVTDPVVEEARLMNMRTYAKRAESNQPLFDPEAVADGLMPEDERS